MNVLMENILLERERFDNSVKHISVKMDECIENLRHHRHQA